MERRTFLKATGGLAATAALSSDILRAASSLIKHIVVVMIENRSSDHFLGWLPNADGKQADLCTFPRSWPRRFPTGFFNSAARRTAWTTANRSVRIPEFSTTARRRA